MQTDCLQRQANEYRISFPFISCLLALCVWTATIITPGSAITSRYLYVWTGDEDRKDSDFLAVVDIQPTGSRYYIQVWRLSDSQS